MKKTAIVFAGAVVGAVMLTGCYNTSYERDIPKFLSETNLNQEELTTRNYYLFNMGVKPENLFNHTIRDNNIYNARDSLINRAEKVKGWQEIVKSCEVKYKNGALDNKEKDRCNEAVRELNKYNLVIRNPKADVAWHYSVKDEKVEKRSFMK